MVEDLAWVLVRFPSEESVMLLSDAALASQRDSKISTTAKAQALIIDDEFDLGGFRFTTDGRKLMVVLCVK